MGEAGRSAESGLTASSRLTRNFEYSQAYYLHVVRAALRKAGVLRVVTSANDASDLRSGDFVEYQATFRPNEISALLDILTPDLIAAITHYAVNSRSIRRYTEYGADLEGLQIFAAQGQADAQARSDLARSVAEAVRVDFRSVKTREFYGSIGRGEQEVTAVTICDNPHFVVDDEDRILDGEFTVLGKVTSATTTDVPILERNKVLDRLKPEGVDQFFDMLRDSVGDQARRLEGQGGHSDIADDIFDVALASRIHGPSFKVMPIAIYT